MVVGVRVLLGSDVVHLDHVAALEAALDGALAGDGQPVDLVGVCGETGATSVLLITSAVDDDGVLECACMNPPISSANVSVFVPKQ
jgi:hypothetical protein